MLPPFPASPSQTGELFGEFSLRVYLERGLKTVFMGKTNINHGPTPHQENPRNRHVYRMLYTPPEPPGFYEASPYTSFKDLAAQYYMIQQTHFLGIYLEKP